jgi:hypothetical protein
MVTYDELDLLVSMFDSLIMSEDIEVLKDIAELYRSNGVLKVVLVKIAFEGVTSSSPARKLQQRLYKEFEVLSKSIREEWSNASDEYMDQIVLISPSSGDDIVFETRQFMNELYKSFELPCRYGEDE